MNYIGSKHKLSSFLKETIFETAGDDLSQMVFCDIFAGTGIVGRLFKSSVEKIIANDCEYYSYVLNRNYIGNSDPIPCIDEYIYALNSLPVVDNGFIFQNYCLGGNCERQYFSDYNGKKIDTVRLKIEEWKNLKVISEDAYFYLLCCLIESADKVANTASVYGAFLKNLKKTALNNLVLQPVYFEETSTKHDVFQMDANDVIYNIEGDILYMDPPYNQRQYGANYHLLNTIAEYKPFIPQGKTGLRSYNRSHYCNKRRVASEFEELVKNARFKYIFLSYNNEGLMSVEEVRSIMEKYGHYDLSKTKYQRFKADKSENRNHKADATVEYLHILEKNG